MNNKSFHFTALDENSFGVMHDAKTIGFVRLVESAATETTAAQQIGWQGHGMADVDGSPWDGPICGLRRSAAICLMRAWEEGKVVYEDEDEEPFWPRPTQPTSYYKIGQVWSYKSCSVSRPRATTVTRVNGGWRVVVSTPAGLVTYCEPDQFGAMSPESFQHSEGI